MTGFDQLTAFINRRLGEARATSVLRLGDGEGMILAKPTPTQKILWAHVYVHFGPQITSGQINSLANMLACAIESADVVGVRNDILNVEFHADHFKLPDDEFLRRFQASFKLRPVEIDLSYNDALRLAWIHQYLSTQQFREGTLFSSAWSHFQLSSSGMLVKIIREQERVGLISSKVELANELEKHLNISVDFYRVPELYSDAVNGTDRVHFPDEFDRTMQSLQVNFPGELFLVGAGVCGKIYCNRIKELGGIALDIGAVCDAWINIPSRKLVFQDMFDHYSDSVPENLLLKYQASKF